MSEEQASEWGWEAMGSEEDGENDNTVAVTEENRVKDAESQKLDGGRALPLSVSSDKVQAPKFTEPKHVALSIGSQSLQKGITSSPSFQELERAIGATLAMSLNVADQDQHQSNKGVGFDITQQKLQQQRIKQQQHHRQQQPQYPSAYSPRHGLGQYPPPHPLTNQQSSARNELGLFVNESESRAIILFHSPLVSPIAVRDACQKCGVLYYIRPEFHGKGVTLLSYFDLRSAIHAHASVVEELGPGAEASAHYSVMLHAANNNSEEFRLVARNLPEGHPEAEVQSIFSRYGQLRSIQRIFGTNEEDDASKPLDPDSESSSATSTEESAFKVEYFNIQDARLAASELCATSAQLLGPDAVVSFAPLDSRKQQLCRQLLATLSRWRSELSSTPSSLSSHSNMSHRGAGGMGGLGMYSTSPGSSSYQMPVMQQQTFQGMYGASGGIGVGGVLMDPSMGHGHGAQQYPMGMGIQMGMGMLPYGVSVQVPYNHNMQQPQQLQQQQPRHFDFKDSSHGHGAVDKYRMRSGDSSSQSSDGSAASASKDRDNSNHGHSGQQQSSRNFDLQDQRGGGDAWGGNSSNIRTHQPQSYADKSGSSHGDETTSGDFNQPRSHYASYGSAPAPQSQQQHLFMQQQQQQGPGYRNKAMPHHMGQQLQQQHYSYQQQAATGATDFYGQSHRPHHHNGGHGQHLLVGYAQGHGQGQGSMAGRRAGKGSMSSAQPFSAAGSGQGSGGMGGGMGGGNSSGSSGAVGGDFTQADFSLDISRVNEGEDLRTTVMVRNIPNKYQQQMLLEEINVSHEGTYDFFYLPIDFKNKCNVGYCFINFLDPKHIVAFVKEFNGLRWKSFNSEKVCAITFARIQGKGSMVSRFQNSSLLEKDDEYRPLLFFSSGPDRGKPEPFPSSSRSMSHTSNNNNTSNNGNSSNNNSNSNSGSSKYGAGYQAQAQSMQSPCPREGDGASGPAGNEEETETTTEEEEGEDDESSPPLHGGEDLALSLSEAESLHLHLDTQNTHQ